MVERFSPEWIARLDRVLAATAATDPDEPICIEHTVVGGDADDQTWHVLLGGARPQAAPGPAPDPTTGSPPVVRLRSSLTTATELSDGADAPRAAFMRGDLQVGGDTTALVRASASLTRLVDAIAVAEADEPGS